MAARSPSRPDACPGDYANRHGGRAAKPAQRRRAGRAGRLDHLPCQPRRPARVLHAHGHQRPQAPFPACPAGGGAGRSLAGVGLACPPDRAGRPLRRSARHVGRHADRGRLAAHLAAGDGRRRGRRVAEEHRDRRGAGRQRSPLERAAHAAVWPPCVRLRWARVFARGVARRTSPASRSRSTTRSTGPACTWPPGST